MAMKNITLQTFIALTTLFTTHTMLPAAANARSQTPIEVSMDLATDFHTSWRNAPSPQWKRLIQKVWLLKLKQVSSTFSVAPHSPTFEMDGAQLRASREGFYLGSPLYKALNFSLKTPNEFSQVEDLKLALGVPDFTNMPSLSVPKITAKRATASTATAAAPQVPNS
jgi:hypothetical protein